MEEKCYIWDDENQELVLFGPSRDEEDKKKIKKRKSPDEETKVYCPHKRLIFNFKETLNFNEQSHFRKHYQRKPPSTTSAEEVADVVLLQDIKDLALFLLASPVSLELLGFLHLRVVDRFLRALILYLQHFLTTWDELAAKRAASAKKAPNPLAGGARVQRAGEMRALRCVLAREYVDLLMGCQKEAKRYHHMGAGEMSFAQSKGEKDFRIFEGLIQFAHRVAWIALERRQKELMELEIHRLFRTNAFNIAKRKYEESGAELEAPEDEHWILYGSKMPPRRKILSNSPLPYEVLYTNCDYRILSLGLTNATSQCPRIQYLENALLAEEEDLPRLGIKVGILGLPRTDFDLLLIPQASEEEQMIVDDAPEEEEEEGADDYETLMPPCADDPELSRPFPVKGVTRYVGDEQIRIGSRKKWRKRELKRISTNYASSTSI